jgi:hypothetical protein
MMAIQWGQNEPHYLYNPQLQFPENFGSGRTHQLPMCNNGKEDKMIKNTIAKTRSKLLTLIKRFRMFRHWQPACDQVNAANSFDIVAAEQRKQRKEADDYRYFVKAGLVNIEETKKLYRWFDKDGTIRDPDGKTRIKLLRKLSNSDVAEVVNLEKLRFQPSRLVNEIRRRTAKREVRQ